MTDPAHRPNLAAKVRDLERRLEKLERAPSLPFSSTRGGLFEFQDDDGAPRWQMGNVQLQGGSQVPTSAYGVFGRGDNGGVALALREGERGLVIPTVPIPFHDPAPYTVTSATFVTLLEASIAFPSHEVIRVQGAVVTDPGTTAEIRLLETDTNTTTSVVPVPAGTSGIYSFEWLHPGSVGLYDTHPHGTTAPFLGLQARRVAGAGTVFVFPPQTADYTSKLLFPSAGTNGNPQLHN